MNNWIKEINKFKQELKGIKKDGNNAHLKSDYYTYEQLLDKLKELEIATDSIAVWSTTVNERNNITLQLRFTNGEFSLHYSMEVKDNTNNNNQLFDSGSKMTYGGRYLLQRLLGIGSEEDPEEDKNTKPENTPNPQAGDTIEGGMEDPITPAQINLIKRLHNGSLTVNEIESMSKKQASAWISKNK